MVIVAAKDGVEDGLMNDVAVYKAGGGEVVYLHPVSDIEGVFEKDEDAAGEELMEDAADDEGEADEDKRDGLLD